MTTQVAKATGAAVIPSTARNYGVFLLAADSDSWLCPASKEQRQTVAAAPALIHKRVHKSCRAMAPKAAACLAIIVVSLSQTASRPAGQ